jgi:hypothetical protein
MWKVLQSNTKELLLNGGATIYDDFEIRGVDLGIDDCIVEYHNDGKTVYTLKIPTPFARKLNE